MFKEFKLNVDRNFFAGKKYTYDEYIDIGLLHLESVAETFEKDMYTCINGNTTEELKIEGDWFPRLRIDVFISHSWTSDGMQIAVAGWLYDTFGLKCMIDSYIWNNTDKMIDEYNNLYSRRKQGNGSDVFDYGCGNRVACHVVSMLHTASMKMMDKAEAVMFLNIDEDRCIYENRSIAKTYQPWIYTELSAARNIRKKPLYEYRYRRQAYTIVADGLSEYITENELRQWEQFGRSYVNSRENNSLDILYNILR